MGKLKQWLIIKFEMFRFKWVDGGCRYLCRFCEFTEYCHTDFIGTYIEHRK